mgnify:FL=1
MVFVDGAIRHTCAPCLANWYTEHEKGPTVEDRLANIEQAVSAILGEIATAIRHMSDDDQAEALRWSKVVAEFERKRPT